MILKNNLKNLENILALSLDIDNTITQFCSTPQYLADTLETFQLPYSKEVLQGYFQAIKQFEANITQTGEISSDIFATYLWNNIEILRQNGISAINFKDTLFDKEASYTKTEEGIQKDFNLLKQNFRLFCYTKWFYAQQQRKLVRHNLLQYIEKIYALEDDSKIKTKQGYELLATNLRKKGISKKEFVHIGDSMIDIVPCESVGIQAILMDYKEDKQELYPMASAVVTEFSDLKRILIKK